MEVGEPSPQPARGPFLETARGDTARILSPPRNCWQIAHATRAAFLVDGEAYFSAFRTSALNATRSIVIVGWDLDSRTALVPGTPNDGFPARLGELLEALMRRRRGLEIYILNWNFYMVYAPDRELFPAFKLGWRNRRLHFHLDAVHPIGASHHQKVVVIDDALAFVGGLDLGECRWDTPAHSPQEERRCKQNGTSYPPYHDVELMVDGGAAAALGRLARERWRRAKGHEPRIGNHATVADPWPASIAPDLTDVEVAIARTEPGYKRYRPIQEVRELYIDSIAAARRHIYIENQYLTAHAVGEALEKRLRAPDGPEIVIVSRRRGGGWLERGTMSVLRSRLLKRLRAADTYRRLRVYYPDNAALGEGCIDVHSKVMIVDDRLVRLGSANLANRSMGLDTECDLAIEASDSRTAQAIARFRHRLLAEHLGVESEDVARTMEQKSGSLIATIEALQGGPRSLKPLAEEISPELDAIVPSSDVIDPQEPIDPDQLMNELVPAETHDSARRRIAAIAGVLFTLAALVAAWRWSPLREWVSAGTVLRHIAALESSPFAWLWVLGGYLAASLTAVPITVLIVATVVVFGPIAGFGYALFGSVLGALLTFGIGQLIGHRPLRRLAGTRLNKISRRLGQHGLLAVFAVRVLPVAPFTVINLVAGASHIGVRDFLLGTVLGMTPGILAITLFSDRLVAVVRDPSPATFAIFVLAVIAIVAGALAVRAWIARHSAARAAEPDPGA